MLQLEGAKSRAARRKQNLWKREGRTETFWFCFVWIKLESPEKPAHFLCFVNAPERSTVTFKLISKNGHCKHISTHSREFLVLFASFTHSSRWPEAWGWGGQEKAEGKWKDTFVFAGGETRWCPHAAAAATQQGSYTHTHTHTQVCAAILMRTFAPTCGAFYHTTS